MGTDGTFSSFRHGVVCDSERTQIDKYQPRHLGGTVSENVASVPGSGLGVTYVKAVVEFSNAESPRGNPEIEITRELGPN
jgi:hypothetical protein